MKYLINKEFPTKTPEISARVMTVAESFGLGIEEEKPFVLYKDVEIELEKSDIVYITGDSGGGKSVLLKELKKLTNGIGPEDVVIDKTKPIIDTLGQTVEEALQLLGLVGLSDAFVCLRYFDQLSDGQKSRYLLAKMLESDNEFLLIDEFCALLDRETAKVVAYSMQKICRKTNRTLIVATTHNDLVGDLNPSLKITKFFGGNVNIERIPYEQKLCSLLDEIKIEEGTKEDWLRLSQFHYRSHKINAYSNIYKMTLNDETIGVIVYGYGPLSLKARNIATNNIYVKNGKQMNKEVRIISRVVILPKYRGIGLSVKIIKETKHLVGVRFVEILSAMGVNNPFAVRAGMTDIPYTREVKGVEKKSNLLLEKLGFDNTLMNSQKYNTQKLAEVPYETKEELFNMLCRVHNMGKGNEGKKYCDHDDNYLGWLIKRTRIAHKAYAIWENPDWVGETVEITNDELTPVGKQLEIPENQIDNSSIETRSMENPTTYPAEMLNRFYEEKMYIDETENAELLEKIKQTYVFVDDTKKEKTLALLSEYQISKMTVEETPTEILKQVFDILLK